MTKKTIHIVPSCGKLSACVAILAAESGYDVRCYDTQPQNPMLAQLQQSGLHCHTHMPLAKDIRNDVVLVGNSLSRSHPWVSSCMAEGVRLHSMPQWLYENILSHRRVIAVSGTHGKTTTTSLIAYLMKRAGHDVGYLVGGQCLSLGVSAQLGTSAYFVIEADEYDTAFFDKRAKFFWYWPYVALVNNLELDHADIYPDLKHLHTAFRQWLQCVPPQGSICLPASLNHLTGLCSDTQVRHFENEGIQANEDGYQSFRFDQQGDRSVSWQLLGIINAKNMVAACSVLDALGLNIDEACQHAKDFSGVDRRMSLVHQGDYALYDDFAHHPTSLKALCELPYQGKLHLIIYPENMYMKTDRGIQAVAELIGQTKHSIYFLHNPQAKYKTSEVQELLGSHFFLNDESLLDSLTNLLSKGDSIVTASAKYLVDLHQKLVDSPCRESLD